MSQAKGDTTTDYVAEVVPAGKYLVNPYENWAVGEGVPIVTGRAIDLMSVETRPWARFDCRGAIAHVDGRCDFLTVFVHEIAPGKAMAPQRHIYDELCVVLSGEGETEIETQDGMHVVAWGPGVLISPPTNARYRHRNTGATSARLSSFNDLRYLLSLFRSQEFVFANASFSSPLVGEVACKAGGGDGRALSTPTPGPSPQGGGETSLVIGSGTIGADVIEIAAGSHTTARRQMQGAHLLGIGGDGVTLSSRDAAGVSPLAPTEPAEAQRYDQRSDPKSTNTHWRHGMLVGLPGMHFHRHVNTGAGPARALDIQLGSAAFPMTRSRRKHYGDESVYASGSAKVP